MKKIILASQSARRRELLQLAGIEFESIPSDYNEKELHITDPEELVMALSKGKCLDIAGKIKDGSILPSSCTEEDLAAGVLVIGSDTVVAYKNTILGKPANEGDALAMLRILSGRTHTVFTGVAVADTSDGSCRVFCEHTDVTFFPLSDEEIRDYIATGEPMDKAGAYGIQGRGALLVESITGDYYTVVGLPIAKLIRFLRPSGNNEDC